MGNFTRSQNDDIVFAEVLAIHYESSGRNCGYFGSYGVVMRKFFVIGFIMLYGYLEIARLHDNRIEISNEPTLFEIRKFVFFHTPSSIAKN